MNWGAIGTTAMATGAAMSKAIGGVRPSRVPEDAVEVAASAAEFAARISDIDARQAEDDAQYAIQAGQREASLYAMRAGQEKEAGAAELPKRHEV
jgi:F0F1-type ATP synthase epsilon subunit